MEKTKVSIVEHSGKEHLTEVENFSAAEIHQNLKEAQSHSTSDYTVLIGEVIIDARSVNSVKKIES